ncbi:MAG TPA: hypothetical protein VMQ17_09960 [Candidatus Sulfotelmatobacter sp.]|nr:hypothetical protein [Candidatus Sulfotelmatobacter sp.]
MKRERASASRFSKSTAAQRTPEGTRDGLLSPEGKLVLARGADGEKLNLRDRGRRARAESRPVPGLTEADVLAQWSVDGGSVLV